MAPYFNKSAFVALLALAVTSGMSLPAAPVASTIITSVLDPRIWISYQETQICETTSGVRSYAGYVNIPANASDGQAYDIHTFFWFFEARNNYKNAPLSLWLQGGPGSPSTPAAVGENGPCIVMADSKTTELNPWSWNNDVNMLYIDQPVQTGFSYDTLINGTIDETISPFTAKPVSASTQLNTTTLAGVFSSQNPASTANTTSTAARAAWYFMQTWIQNFPDYKPADNKFSIWGESYGGHYVPTFADFFEEQNDRLADGAVALNLDTVGLVNGCLDILTQMPFYPEMAINNTYGLKLINDTQYQADVTAFATCKTMSESCRSLADKEDPLGLGNNADVNAACSKAYTFCFNNMTADFAATGHNVFDITAPQIGAFPPKYAAGYLNSAEVQKALGVPLNFTGLSTSVTAAFGITGDFVIGKNLAILGQLLDKGVKVALVYGDRDYQCNWMGGEAISLAINSTTSSAFQQAGYTQIQTNASYVGGMVRQHGNLSFSRVFEAGHQVPYYQPETAYQIFKRVMFNTDVATGNAPITSTYATTGPATILDVKNAMPAPVKQECYFWDMLETCTTAQKAEFRNGTALMSNFVMTGHGPISNASSGASALKGMTYTSLFVVIASIFTFFM